jgi:hypothetical protein
MTNLRHNEKRAFGGDSRPVGFALFPRAGALMLS